MKGVVSANISKLVGGSSPAPPTLLRIRVDYEVKNEINSKKIVGCPSVKVMAPTPHQHF